jgi:hypothetical protein
MDLHNFEIEGHPPQKLFEIPVELPHHPMYPDPDKASSHTQSRSTAQERRDQLKTLLIFDQRSFFSGRTSRMVQAAHLVNGQWRKEHLAAKQAIVRPHRFTKDPFLILHIRINLKEKRLTAANLVPGDFFVDGLHNMVLRAYHFVRLCRLEVLKSSQ